jgi:heme-degrading monooxygenase HmoA
MYLRFVRLYLREGAEPAFRKFYTERVQPALAATPGCLFAGLLAPWLGDEHRSLTLWRSADDARAYEEGGLYHQLLREVEPYLSARTVWRARLVDDASGSGEAIQREIPPEGYELESSAAASTLERPGRSLYVRIVAVHVASERQREFVERYRDTVLPALRAFPGCHGAFLAEAARNPNEMLSISVWDREESATRYEMSGEFERLIEETRSTFSPLRQWQFTLRDGGADERQAQPDVATYHLVHGRRLSS